MQRLRTTLPAAATLLLALCALALASFATAVAAPAAANAAPVVTATTGGAAPLALAAPGRRIVGDELARTSGGICTTCNGNGGGGSGNSGAPVKRGSPYWETYRVSLNSSSSTPASLISKIDNWSDVTINGTFDYTRKVVHRVLFSGGYASFIRASIGGEVSQSTRTSVTYPIPARHYGKLYVRYRSERRTYYGHRYQDLSNGRRTIVDNASGPYLNTSTILGYVTGLL